MGGKRLTQKRKEEIMRYVRESRLLTPSLISKATGVPKTTVTRVLHANGYFLGKGAHSLGKLTIRVPDDKAKLGYIASALDCEGVIGFKKDNRMFEGKGFHIAIFNTDKRLMDWLVKNVGGHVCLRNRNSDKRGIRSLKTEHHWFVSRILDALSLLMAIEPYLVLKREEARQVIEYCERHIAQKYGKDALPLLLSRSAGSG